jgi:hypothetical protein
MEMLQFRAAPRQSVASETMTRQQLRPFAIRHGIRTLRERESKNWDPLRLHESGPEHKVERGQAESDQNSSYQSCDIERVWTRVYRAEI